MSIYLKGIIYFSFLLAGPLAIKAQDYLIKEYDVEIEISQDGYFDVNEKIDVFFNKERRGIIRNIPKVIKVNGKSQSIKLSNVKVQGHNYKILSEGNDKLIRIGEADKYITGPVTYHISYRLTNAYIFTDTHVEFLYNLIADWDCPIEKVNYSVSIPEDFEIAFNDYKVITGADGLDEREASLLKEGKRFTGSSLKPLDPEENITLAIKFPKGYITQPPEPPGIFELDKFWAIPLALLFYMFNFFFKSRKEFEPLSSIEQYYPPEDMSPAEVGAYYDNKVNTEDIISLLPYWADKGYIKIMGNEMEGKDKDLYFKKLSELPDDSPEYQHYIFNEVFKDDDIVLLSEFKNKFYNVVFKASSKIHKTLMDKELFDRDHYSTFHSGKFAFGGLILIITGVALILALKLFLTGAVTVVLGVCAAVIHFLRPKRSEKGIRIQSQLEALKRFLSDDDGSKTSELMHENKGYLESVYPYAVALGVDKSWLSKLEDSAFEVYAPYWFVFYNQQHVNQRVPLSQFNENFSVPEIKSVFTSYPAGQSGGSGGGGFSGGSAGGGVGGGGSSW